MYIAYHLSISGVGIIQLYAAKRSEREPPSIDIAIGREEVVEGPLVPLLLVLAPGLLVVVVTVVVFMNS